MFSILLCHIALVFLSFLLQSRSSRDRPRMSYLSLSIVTCALAGLKFAQQAPPDEEEEIPMADQTENEQENLIPPANANENIPADGQVDRREGPREREVVERREMRELARPVVTTSSSCLVLTDAARNYELKGFH